MKRRTYASSYSGPSYDEVADGLRELIVRFGGDPDAAEGDMAFGEAVEMIWQLATDNTMSSILDRRLGRR